MNITELKKTVPTLLKNKIVPFIWGNQGLGKSQVMKQIAKEQDLQFIHLHLATQEVGDLVGLLIHGEGGTVKHSRPEWFPTSGRGMVFLDELNRASPEVIQCMFSFITDGTIHTHKLPEGWSIVAAGNYQSNSFNVTDTSDSAWMSRFCHLDFKPSKEEFIFYAEGKELYSVADFIREQPKLLEADAEQSLNKGIITPDRRSWVDMIGKLEFESSLEDVRFEVYEGILGTAAAAAFLNFKRTASTKIKSQDIIDAYSNVKSKVLRYSNNEDPRLDILNQATDELMSLIENKELTEQQLKNFKEYISDVPVEMGLKIINSLHKISWKQKGKILNDIEFVNLFRNNKLKRKNENN